MDENERRKQMNFMRDLCCHLSEEAQANEISDSIFFTSLFAWSALNMIKDGKFDRGAMNKMVKIIFDNIESSEAIKENSCTGNSNRC
jgi:hypothetical protein